MFTLGQASSALKESETLIEHSARPSYVKSTNLKAVKALSSVPQVFNPIQALMVNRLFNMQLEFVKLLWRYDKRNGLTNGLILWILIKGVLKENIFGDEEFVEQANKLNEMAT